MKNDYYTPLFDIATDLHSQIFKKLNASGQPFIGDVNFAPCRVELLDNDYSTLWVQWGAKYSCEFLDLPALAMGVVANAVLNS